jgi:hypothetical protein
MATAVKVKEKSVMLPLTSIINKFDVRTVLDQDRVIQFAGMYEHDPDLLPPVRVVRIGEEEEEKYAYIDGRTRGAARAYLNLSDVPAVICNGSLRDNPLELFAEALELNWGGAKPPTREDIAHTIQRMLELGISQKAIRERLNFLPSGSASAYIAWARAVLQKRRMARALDAVAEGLSIDSAARDNQIKPDLLRDAIAGKRGNWGAARSDEAQLLVEFKGYISKVLKSANGGISKKLEGTVKKVDAGEVSHKTAVEIVKAWREHLRKTMLRIEDWDARLTALSAEHDKAIVRDEA